ncbi:MAG: hypothetical protein JO049_10555 [Hyphomicrobiales bacterium]|jgi:hypothetical protein|nr:hypothetical protein [Hyphomicrobiales bacterium]
MLSLRTLAIIISAAGIFAGLPFTDARACDDDRYPCPPRLEASTQETSDAPTQPAPLAQSQKKSAQPQKKVKQPAGQNEKAQAKREREALRAATRAKVSKPALQEQAPDSLSQKVAEVAPAVVPSSRANQPFNDTTRNENLVTAWPVLPNVEAADASAPEATAVESEAAKANAVQLVDPNEINDLDRAAAVPAETSWITYLLLILGSALAAASAVWFFSRMTPMFARRAANPRLRMSNS